MIKSMTAMPNNQKKYV